MCQVDGYMQVRVRKVKRGMGDKHTSARSFICLLFFSLLPYQMGSLYVCACSYATQGKNIFVNMTAVMESVSTISFFSLPVATTRKGINDIIILIYKNAMWLHAHCIYDCCQAPFAVFASLLFYNR